MFVMGGCFWVNWWWCWCIWRVRWLLLLVVDWLLFYFFILFRWVGGVGRIGGNGVELVWGGLIGIILY